ncbi:acetyltransferase [Idiomarina xiamenensis]|uniref:Acetyltransferase n=1 Tax=Idiomarina xiamenensis 10-D-4 TaxID=740709 RepID=K2K6X1_9GAMM|nr:acetyltransferase [Idiomarina xiamenensis]EKE83418.1 acetyltransferase [Idiomarina xiamenensis 10-D-4]
MSERHWASRQERGSYLGIVTLLTLYRYGGRWLLKLLLAPIISYFLLTGGDARRASLQYLRRLHRYCQQSGQPSPFRRVPGWRHSWRHFWQFGLAAVDKIDAWIGRIKLADITYRGDITFKALNEQPQGGLLLCSHLGNIEVARAMSKERYQKRMNVLVFTQHARAFNRALQQVNAEAGIDLIQVTDIDVAFAIEMKQRIENGEYVVIVGDRISVTAPEHVIMQDFLGQPAPFAMGPWVLASVLECPVYLMFCMQAQSGYDVYFKRFREQVVLPRKQRHAALQSVVADYAANLAMIAQRYPYQWYNFYDFWTLPAAPERAKPTTTHNDIEGSRGYD